VGTKRIEAALPFPFAYGVALAYTTQVNEHAPHDTWSPDPTPEDGLAFRIVNPQHAPAGFAQRVAEQTCGYACRGW
jgi:hypothetical protein